MSRYTLKQIAAISTALMMGMTAGSADALGWNSKTEKITLRPSDADSRVFEGWGTSLCWWANRLGYSDVLAQKSADLFFGNEGLRLNIMRYNIGGGDDPAHDHITRTDSEVPGWLKWSEEEGRFVYDYTADHNQLNVLDRAVKACGDNALVEVFSNSPPYFMTVSGCSSGAVNPSDTNLREECYQAFAEYLVHVTDYIQHELDIPVVSLSPMNEPDTDYWRAMSDKQEGCHLDPGKVQSGVIEAVADALANSQSTNVIIAASDETSPIKQVQEYYAYTTRAKMAIGRINTHSYIEDGRKALGKLARQQDFALWMSEVDGSGVAGDNAGEMGCALWLGQKIIADLNELRPTAWVTWQVVDNHISRDGYNGNRDYGMVDVNQGFWGVAVADHDNQEIILTQKYYGMGQFTRFIRPGSRLIPCTQDTIAAYDEQNQQLVIVSVNASGHEKQLRADLSAFDISHAQARGFRTSGSMQEGEQWADIGTAEVTRKGFEATLKPNSITTWVLDGVQP